MKNFIFLFLLTPFVFYGQTQFENYIKTTSYKIPVTTSITNPAITTADVSIMYLDGLGRPKQKVMSKQSASGKNIIVPYEYDSFGREPKKFLPYSSTNSGFNIETNNVLNYYLSPTVATTGNPNFESTANPYEESEFEDSPLNRVIEQAAPGNAWAMSLHNTSKFAYALNENNEVKLFTADAIWNSNLEIYSPSLTNAGTTYYIAKTLTKNVISDENSQSGTDGAVTEYRDSKGQIVLRRVSTGSINHDTYNVYDQFGNLTYVIPPVANGSITATILDNLCYQYRYDKRNRMVEKKLPGKQWEFIIYDNLDRPIALGPTLAPFNTGFTAPNNIGWLITKYDNLNRVVYTGWLLSSAITPNDRKALQSDRNLETINFSENKIQNATDNFVNGIAFRYTNQAWPTGNTYHILKVNYYDDYNFPNAPTPFPQTVMSDNTQNVYYNNTTRKPKGLITGTWVRALTTQASIAGESTYLLYDNKSRLIRLNSKNYLGGLTRVDNKIHFSGKLLKSEVKHKRLDTTTEVNTTENFTYTDQGRIFTHTHQINTEPIELLSENTYDELGRIVSKKVGNNNNGSFLQKIDYTFNIRGWLKGINNDPTDQLLLNSAENDIFAYKINYNTVENYTGYTGQPLYNGNISETYWRTSTDNILRKYGYKYDKLNRFKEAIYMRPENSTKVTNSYNETASYDLNGNITALYRTGNFDSYLQSIPIDDLVYSYKDNATNQLTRIVDNAGADSALGFKANALALGRDAYEYDAFGNLITDLNKGINSAGTNPITYNHLNLPLEITFNINPVRKINFIYDANGKKLQKIVTSGSTITTTDYLDGYQYRNETLQFFPNSEGYVNYYSGIYKYVYNYKDHLGNVRVSYAKNPNTNSSLPILLEQSHYYPFGLKHTNYNTALLKYNDNIETAQVSTYEYKYNGKEYQYEFGINVTAMDYRQYDSAIGRFLIMDPLAEKVRFQSPYQFANNNPVVYSDPSGLCPECDEAYADSEPYGGELYHSRGGATYEFDEIAGQWNRIDLKNDLEEVVVDGKEKLDYGFLNEWLNDIHESYNNDARDVAEIAQNVGNSLSAAGMVLVASGIGAPIGAGLMSVGGAIALTGDVAETLIDWNEGKFKVDDFIIKAAFEFAPYGFEYIKGTKDLGLDNILVEAWAMGSEEWFEYMNTIHP